MLLCLTRGRVGEIYHITGPRPVSFRELGETMAAALDVRRPRLSFSKGLAMFGASGLQALAGLVDKEPPISRTGIDFFSEDRAFSWKKAHEELGYRPHVELKQGVQQSVTWYRQHDFL
jgi:nucleoside-diphosphate-sugar epimerase